MLGSPRPVILKYIQYLWKWPPTSTWTLALTHHLPHQELPVHCQYLWSDVAIPENKRSAQWIFLFRHIMDPLVVHCRPTEAFYKPVSRARVSPSLPWCPSEASLLPQSDSARAHLEDNQLPCCGVVTRTDGANIIGELWPLRRSKLQRQVRGAMHAIFGSHHAASTWQPCF